MFIRECQKLAENLFISDCHIPVSLARQCGITAVLTVGSRKIQPEFVQRPPRKKNNRDAKVPTTNGQVASIPSTNGQVESVSSINGELPQPKPRGPEFRALIITMIDEDDENLLRIIPRGLSFIKSSIRQKRNVLVHCAAGMSRSVSMCIAYLLHIGKYKTFTEALADIRAKWSRAWPNGGFMYQLCVYQKLGAPSELRRLRWALTDEEKGYRLILLHRWRRLYQEYHSNRLAVPNGNVDPLRPDPGSKCREEYLLPLKFPENVRTPGYYLKCKHCSVLLCSSLHIFSPPAQEMNRILSKEVPLEERKPNGGPKGGPNDCLNSELSAMAIAVDTSCPDSFDLFPPRNMRDTISQDESSGDLLCPRCKCKIGTYNWKAREVYMRVLATPSHVRILPAMELCDVRTHLPEFTLEAQYLDRVFSIDS